LQRGVKGILVSSKGMEIDLIAFDSISISSDFGIEKGLGIGYL
jgi:hypothetical protein